MKKGELSKHLDSISIFDRELETLQTGIRIEGITSVKVHRSEIVEDIPLRPFACTITILHFQILRMPSDKLSSL
jgi:hypothetical protein